MNIRLGGLLALASVLSPAFAIADTITLKNGDHITGAVVKTDGPNLVFKGELTGEVKVPLDSITQLTTTAPIDISLKDGQLIVGTATADAKKLEVQTANAGKVEADRSNVTAIRSVDEQKAYQAQLDRFANPGVLDLWAGTIDLGLALSRGNSQTFNFNTGFNAVRATKRDKIQVYFTSIYATQSTTGVSTVSANAKRGGVAYNINLSPKLFGWGSVDLENDHFQGLDLRFNPNGGLGYHAYKTDHSYLDLVAGGSLNREFYSTFNRTSGEVVFGDDYDWSFKKRSHLHQGFRIFPNVSNTSQYRINFDLTASTALTKVLSLQFTGSDRYITDPPAGRKGNDIILTTGIRLTFAR